MNRNSEPSKASTPEITYDIPQGEVIIGDLVQISALGEPLVNFALNNLKYPLSAISTITVAPKHLGRKVVLMFQQGDLSKPIIIGLLHSPLHEMIENFELMPSKEDVDTRDEGGVQKSPLDLATTATVVDGKKVQIEAEEEIVLKCGESSITLTKAGKIMIRGKYLLNRSTGVNRILGGSVQVN